MDLVGEYIVKCMEEFSDYFSKLFIHSYVLTPILKVHQITFKLIHPQKGDLLLKVNDSSLDGLTHSQVCVKKISTFRLKIIF